MAKDKDKNWVKLYRALMTDELWTSEPFTTGQAWVDLIMMANFAEVERIYKGRYQQIKRGQIATSIRWLAQRWQWSRDKTVRTLKTFEMAKMVSIETTTNGTVLTLENYDKYQNGPATKQATTSTTTQATTQATTPTQYKNDKEGIKKVKDTERNAPQVPAALNGPEGYDAEVQPDGSTLYRPKGRRNK
jgi:hypothetical protein